MTTAEAIDAPCFLCGKPIDYAFTRANPRHAMAATVHHIIGLAENGDPLDPGNLTIAHQGCNSRQGNRVRAQKAASAGLRNSRRW